jgi:glycosyltransferase involved in cell wall biosynthesis
MPLPLQRRKRIVVPLLCLQSFIAVDIETLAREFEVSTPYCKPARGYVSAALELIGADLLFCWFGSIRFLPLALLARLLRKRVVIVAGGYDLANVPEIDYGNMRPGLVRRLTKMLFSLADLILCYSQSAADEAMKAGLPMERVRVLHLGVRAAEYVPGAKEPFVLTVAAIDGATLTRKGLLDVARIAHLLPDVSFVLAGAAASPKFEQLLRDQSPPNLTLRGYVDADELQLLYSRAAVYLQPSRHEAFGLSVGEAMAYGCVVIVGNSYSLPEIVGGCGILVEPGDDQRACTAIRTALERLEPAADAAARVRDCFSPARREEGLLAYIREITASRSGVTTRIGSSAPAAQERTPV